MNQDVQFLCQKHSRLSYDICLHPSQMENRLLCRICKKELPQEKLLEVTSLSDFFSGNFLNAAKDLVEQELKKSQQKTNPVDHTINAFFSDVEQGLLVTLNEVKKKFLEKYVQCDSGKQIKKAADELSLALETFKADPQNKLRDAKLLNRFSQKYSLLVNDSTKYVEQESTNQPNFGQNLGKFEVKSDSYQHFKENCLGKIKSLLEHYENGPEAEINSDGYVDPSYIGIPIFQDTEQEEPFVAKQQTSRESQEKKFPNGVETNHSEDSKKTLDDHVISENNNKLLALKSTTKRVRKYQDSDDVSGDSKENFPPVGPVLKKVKKTVSSRPLEIPNAIETENHTAEEERLYDENKLPTPNPKEISIQPIKTLIGNYEYVLWGGLCYLPDKRQLVAGDQAGNLCVWDVETHEMLFHKYIAKKIYKIIYLSLQGVVLVSREDGEIDIFDIKKNYSLSLCYRKHTNQTFAMIYINSLDLVASAGEEGNILLWNYTHQKSLITPKRLLMTDGMQISALCYIEDKDLLVASTFTGGYLMIFNPSVNQYIEKIKAHNKAKSIDCLLYVPAWKQVVSGSEDCQIKFWKISNLSRNVWEPLCVRALRRNASYIESLVAIPEANCLISTNLDEMFTVWDLGEMKVLYEMTGGTKSEEHGEAMIYLEDRKELVTCFGSEIRLWKVKF